MNILRAILLLIFANTAMGDEHASKMAIGKLIFEDTRLSEPQGQSCSSCHRADKFYADPENIVSPGANPKLFGNRNAPSISYVKFNPALYRDKEEDHWVGGFFLDGRESTLEAQADKPFFNPLEMGNPSPAILVEKISQAPYAALMKIVYGTDVFATDKGALESVRDALATYERGPEFAPFSSRYDAFLKGELQLSLLEQRGLELFEAEDKGNCAACHPSQSGPNGEPPLFTDFTYDNLGVPKNEKLPFFAMPSEFNPQGKSYTDPGMADNPNIFDSAEQQGKFKVSTLRNVANTGPYMHNGIFSTLEEAVEFYNTRDVDSKWGPPEIPENVNKEELGDLLLTDDELKAIVAFLKTLSDGYQKEHVDNRRSALL